jgi:hypothetical protein
VTTTILFSIAVLCPLAALTAQEIKPFDVKPGLWEDTTNIEMLQVPAIPQSAMPQLTPDQLAKMPPAARQQLENMMAGRGGAPITTTTKSCITREMLDKAMAFGDNSRTNCTRKIVNSSPGKFELHFDCEPDKMNVTWAMNMTVERVDAEHIRVSGTMKSTGTGPGGRSAPQTVESKVTASSKWLSSDCGDLNPAGGK